jgi:hypothetical protein
MKSPVESLPVELFDMIAADFTLSEYQSLRLASPRLHQLVHAKFVRLAFSEQSTTLSSSSLDRLIKVSNHRALRDAVRILHIRLLNQHEYANLSAISRVGRFPPPKRFPRVSGVRDSNVSDEAATYAYVLQNERPVRLYDGLLKALKGLSQMKMIYFSMKPSASSVREPNETPHQLFRNRCFEAVIHAVTRSKIKLQEFSMARRKGRKILYKQVDLSFLAFQLDPSSLQAVRQCFSNLQSLTLSIMTGHDKPRPDTWANGICRFIAAATKLKKLTLSLDRVNAKQSSSQFGCILVKSLTTLCRLLDLETLEIMNCALDGKELIDFIRVHSFSLRCVFLSHVQLLTNRWCSIGEALVACQRLECFRLVGFEDPRTSVSVESRIQSQPQIVWDARKNHQSLSDWFHGQFGMDGSEEGSINSPATNNSLHAQTDMDDNHH